MLAIMIPQQYTPASGAQWTLRYDRTLRCWVVQRGAVVVVPSRDNDGDECEGRAALLRDALVRIYMICPTCMTADGSPNTEYLSEHGACTFGCGRRVGDSGICTHCRDHSANEVECETCGRHWADWARTWELQS